MSPVLTPAGGVATDARQRICRHTFRTSTNETSGRRQQSQHIARLEIRSRCHGVDKCGRHQEDHIDPKRRHCERKRLCAQETRPFARRQTHGFWATRAAKRSSDDGAINQVVQANPSSSSFPSETITTRRVLLSVGAAKFRCRTCVWRVLGMWLNQHGMIPWGGLGESGRYN